MTNQGPLGRRGAQISVPRGETVGEFDTYAAAQRTVDRLAKADFPVADVAIVGSDLKTVERVTRKLSWNRAALEGALSGAWFGLFLGLLFTFVSPTINWGLFGAAVLIGAAFGMFFRLATYAVARRNRDFQSTSQVLASTYQVIVEPGLADRARALLSRPDAEH